jgi:chromosomal replication initiation ATPase DnaA
MNLKQLALAAADYYDVSYDKLNSPCRQAEYTRPRHICHWVAAERYTKAEIARFWNIDRTAVYYGCKMVQGRINTSKQERKDIKAFIRHARKWA